ncbi:TPR-like protein [Cryphonectria parasitica EP155]|uniref:Peroxisomal targeting signal receptor n=1 Tax=Cryphonectria parasitica (strain ATCC 38755 / EP155) TaxID=660469 RepID=A0A9P5CT31_CRYP1|nr:TPR-like protein [Cryphonectria parasitica EP155]KAF3769247.1 TPR-like protein [Cryphonectria parasitica EP155]
MASFMGGGAECSTSNPLSQMSKHVQGDSSLQRDRFMNTGPGGASAQGFRSSAGPGTPLDGKMNAFMQQNPNMPVEMALQRQGPGPASGGQIHIDPAHSMHLRAQSVSPPSFSPSFTPDEFAKFQAANRSANARSSPAPQAQSMTVSTYQRPMMMGAGPMSMGMMQQGMYGGMPMYSQQQQQAPAQQNYQTDVKGKGKEVDTQELQTRFEEQFKLHDEHDESLAMEEELNQMDEKLMESETGFGDFESIWKGIQEGEAAMRSMPDDDLDIKWGDGIDSWGGGGGRMSADPLIEDYLFEQDNLFKDQANPFEEGVRIMDEGGNLSLAALAFEAAAQKDPKHIEAWARLGSAQSQNEKEDAALRAYQRVLQLDPHNLDALMGLAVSYTNEGYDSTAYRTLERWLSVKYPQVISPDALSNPAEVGFTDRAELHNKITGLFIEAAQYAPDGEHMDPDVQVGLGVLFYGSEDFDKAVDCFHAALASSELGIANQRNQLHLLWNRLGATLANSGKSEEAIAAYEKALALRPNFVRARYNLGVSCMNIGCYEQAAGHLLSALAMHKTVEKAGREKARELLSTTGDGADVSDEHLDRMTTHNRSTTLYDTLRRVFTLMSRRDLSEKVVFGVDPDIFRPEFEF